MMVVNFSQDNYNQKIRLPVAGSARPVEKASAAEDRLTLNIDRDGHLLFNGESYDTERAIQQIQRQAELVRLNVQVTTGKKPKPSDPLPTVLVIRADRNTPYSQFFRIVTACQAQGFQKFALKAMYEGG